MIDTYFGQLQQGLDAILSQERRPMNEASDKLSQKVKNGGIIYIFGCGHSHMVAEEMFYRAGGLASVNPVLVESLMLHEGAIRSSRLEKSHDYGAQVLNEIAISERDAMIVVSTSGRNPVPIDVALAAREAGAFVMALTSFEYASMSSRHKSGQHLSEAVELVVDNHVRAGDAVLQHEKVKVPFAPVSTIHNTAILNAVFAGVISRMANEGNEPPVFLSANLDNTGDHNLNLIARYEDRIPLLKAGE